MYNTLNDINEWKSSYTSSLQNYISNMMYFLIRRFNKVIWYFQFMSTGHENSHEFLLHNETYDQLWKKNLLIYEGAYTVKRILALSNIEYFKLLENIKRGTHFAMSVVRFSSGWADWLYWRSALHSSVIRCFLNAGCCPNSTDRHACKDIDR